MKTRTGFVSNSSSSSFIIGVGVVKDQFAFEMSYPSWTEYGSLPDDMVAVTIAQLKSGTRTDGNLKLEYDNAGNIIKVLSIEVESFDYSTVSMDLSECNDDDIVLVYSGGYSLDESDMAVFDDDGEFMDYDYNIDPDAFNDDEHAAMTLLDSILVDGEYTYGAGRNG